MFGYVHQILPAMTGILGVATVWADAGYLPRTGPIPLRFRDPPAPMVKQIDTSFPPPFLPPFFPPATLTSLPTPLMPSRPPDAAKTTNAPVLPGPATNGTAVEFNAREAVTDPAPAAAQDAIVSPQMLIKYFSTSTNGGTYGRTNAAGNTASLGAVAPFGFTPPPMTMAAPTPPPSSTGTYSTSP